MIYKITSDAASNTYSVVVTLTDRDLAVAKAATRVTGGIAGNLFRGPAVTNRMTFGGRRFDGYEREVAACMTQLQSELDNG